MTSTDTIETRLLQALSVEPSADGLRWLDQRVADLATRPAAEHRGARGRRFFLRPLVLIAAFVLLTGAVTAGLGLLDRIVESSGGPGWRTAWDRAERLDLTATDAGVTIKVERAYADLNQVLVGFTVAGLAAPAGITGESAPLEWMVEIRDPTGRSSEQWATSRSGMEMEETGLTAVIHTWEGAVAPTAGTWVLTFSSVGYNGGGFVPGQCDVDSTEPECVNPPPSGMVNGSWRFEFALPAPAGTVVSPNVSVTQGQATLTLTEMRITPTMVTSRIAMRVTGSDVVDWHPNISIRRGDTTYISNSSYHVTQDPNSQGPNGDVNEFLTISGADVASGTWVIEIPELTYRSSTDTPIEDEIHLIGPWTLTVAVP